MPIAAFCLDLPDFAGFCEVIGDFFGICSEKHPGLFGKQGVFSEEVPNKP